MKAKNLKSILDNHEKWLSDKSVGDKADLRWANLRGANLRGVALRQANLCEADLRGADLREADLREADLREANLCGADLLNTNLSEIKGFGQFIRTLQHGSFIGWKKSREGHIIKLLVPDDARRVNAIGSFKCRCDKVTVLAIFKAGTTEVISAPAWSQYDNELMYAAGKNILVNDYDPSDRI